MSKRVCINSIRDWISYMLSALITTVQHFIKRPAWPAAHAFLFSLLGDVLYIHKHAVSKSWQSWSGMRARSLALSFFDFHRLSQYVPVTVPV